MAEKKQINTRTVLSYLNSAFTAVAEYVDLIKQKVSFGGVNSNLQSAQDVKQGGLNNELQGAATVKNGGLE